MWKNGAKGAKPLARWLYGDANARGNAAMPPSRRDKKDEAWAQAHSKEDTVPEENEIAKAKNPINPIRPINWK